MSRLVPTLAAAFKRLKPEEVVELVALLTQGHEINLTLSGPEAHGIPDGYVLMPRKMTSAMIYAARHHSWTEVTFASKLPLMWRDIIEAVETA